MAPLLDALLAQLQKLDLLHRVDEIIPMFEGAIDVGATINLHADAFTDVIEYMDKHISEYSILFEGAEGQWVPIDFIKYIFREEKTFRFRLSRFTKSLTERDYKIEEEDLLMDLDMGNIGTAFLNWDMVSVLLLLEGLGKESGKQTAQAKAMPVEQIQEAHAHEENVTDQWEASMALVCLQGTAPKEDLDLLVEGDEVLKEIPDLSILSLSPIILDGKEFLFLDDISKTIGLREDEALSVLAVNAGAACKSTDKGKAKIEFEDDHLTKALAYNASSSSLEAVVVKALIEIKEEGAFYESVYLTVPLSHTCHCMPAKLKTKEA